MYLRLSNDADFDVRIDLPSALTEPLLTQVRRLGAVTERMAFEKAVLNELASALTELLDAGITPPTDKQIAFARALSRKHHIRIPREALMFRAAMSKFLDQHVNKRGALKVPTYVF